MDEKILLSLGLKPKEVLVYKTILKAGQASPALLGRLSGIQRTTAYGIARGLVERGFLSEDATRRPRVFTVSSPEEVLALIEKEKLQIQEREESVRTLANELSKLSASESYPVPTVRFIEESKLEAFLRQQADVWDKSILESGETSWWGFQDHTFVEHYGGWITWYWKRFPKGIDLKLLSNRASVEIEFAKEREHLGNRNIKFWGEATDFLSTTWIVGDYLVMINTRAKPFYLVEIHDKLMAHDQREVFKNLWQLI